MTEFTAHDELAQLLGLDIIGITVLGAHLYGRGREGKLVIELSGSRELGFDPASAAARPQAMLSELALECGVAPDLKQKQCMHALTLAHRIATTHREMTEVEQARGWGVEYLQAAKVIDVVTTDQRERWGAWQHLATHDPWMAARENGDSIANHGILVRDVTGDRLVRSGWFLAFVRTIAPRVSHMRLPTLMEEAGWHAPKRFKATSPSQAGQSLQWNFYAAPAGWEDQC